METETQNPHYKIISADAVNFTHKVQFNCKGVVAFETGGEIDVDKDTVLIMGINDDWDFLPITVR